MAQPVIVLAGYPRAGKGEIAKSLTQRYGAWVYTVSSTFFMILKILGVDPKRENLTRIAMAVVDMFGQDAVMAQTCRLVRANLQTPEDAVRGHDPFPKMLIVDGIRFPEHVKIVRREFPGCKIIGVWAPPVTRHRRHNALRDAKSGGTELSLEMFMAQDELPTERQIGEVLKLADTTIDNDGTLEDLHAAIDNLMTSWGILPT